MIGRLGKQGAWIEMQNLLEIKLDLSNWKCLADFERSWSSKSD